MKLKRKLKRKWENIGTNQKFMVLFVGLLCFITVGYAVINQALKITGYASLDMGDGMIFTSIGIKENNGATIEKDASIKAKTLVNTQVSFQSAGSITFNVSAQNQGTTDAKLIEIKGLEESNIKEPSCIQVSVQDHNVGDLVYPNQVKNFTITITSTCSTYSSKEFDLQFAYEKQETINGTLPYDTLETVTTDLLNNSGDGTYNYMNGTYLKGGQDSNYVWFDGFMWRIMGKNEDGSIRMITEENVTAIPWGAENTAQDYDNSYVNDWLNNYFYPKLEHKDLLVNQTWCSLTTTDESSHQTSCINNLSNTQKPIGLLSLDEYNLASGSSSYLVNSQYFWTLTVHNKSEAYRITTEGISGYYSIINTLCGVRPMIHVQSDTIIASGQGTLTVPYMIDNTDDVTGSLKDNSHVGEYVTYAGRNYRVVETSYLGTKLILDGYYDSNNDGVIEDSDKMAYGTNCTLCTTINEKSFINWISNNNEIDKNKLVWATWYHGEPFDYGDYYKTSLESTSNAYIGRVGLIRVGEVLSGQSETILSNNQPQTNNYNNASDYWTGSLSISSSVWKVNDLGNISKNNVTNLFAVRPVIMIHPGVPITGGQGTPNEPYTLGEAPPTAAQYLIKNKLSSDINTSPTNGLFAIDNQGELTTSTSPREYRYIGANPDNYIQFNNELWRIIGIFEGQLKIIRKDLLENKTWDHGGTTNWNNKSMQKYFNGEYLEGMDESSQNKIADYTWKLGAGITWNEIVTPQEFYEIERGTWVGNGDPTEWTGKIALMYPSDYGFATSGGSSHNRNSCLATGLFTWSSANDCKNNSWLYDSFNDQWTLTPFVYGRTRAPSIGGPLSYILYKGGDVLLMDEFSSYSARPTLYLQPTVEIASGIGTSSDPYILK